MRAIKPISNNKELQRLRKQFEGAGIVFHVLLSARLALSEDSGLRTDSKIAEIIYQEGRSFLADLMPGLRSYQIEGALFLAAAQRALLLDEMGLGKTVQAIAATCLLQRFGGSRDCLIVAPKSVMRHWIDEINRFAHKDCAAVAGDAKSRWAFYLDKAPFKVVTLESFRNDYCEENFEWLIGERVTLAFPVVCFCDIPLDAAATHRDRYGNYAVGFSKNWVKELDINPVWYVQPGSSIARQLGNTLRTTPRFKLDSLRGHPLRNVLAFIKPTIAFQNDRAASRTGTMEVFPADEEMEWRHTPCILLDKWFQLDDRGFINHDHHALSEKVRLKLSFDQIECILVSSKEEVAKLERKFSNLKTVIRVWP